MSVRTFAGGVLVEAWDDETRAYWHAEKGMRPYTEAEVAPLVAAEQVVAQEDRRAALLGRVDAAITADLAYLDSPVPALALDRLARLEAQVERLTRQVVALHRLVGNRLDDTAGT